MGAKFLFRNLTDWELLRSADLTVGLEKDVYPVVDEGNFLKAVERLGLFPEIRGIHNGKSVVDVLQVQRLRYPLGRPGPDISIPEVIPTMASYLELTTAVLRGVLRHTLGDLAETIEFNVPMGATKPYGSHKDLSHLRIWPASFRDPSWLRLFRRAKTETRDMQGYEEPQLIPTGKHQQVKDKWGNSVAEIHGRDIFLLYNVFPWYGAYPGYLLLRKSLEAVRQALLEGPEQRWTPRFQDTKDMTADRDQYIALCLNNTSPGGVRDSEFIPEVLTLRRQLSELQQQVAQKIRQIREAESQNPTSGDAFGRDYDGLFKIPEVRDVEVHRDRLVVHTDMIYCKNTQNGKLHEIGRFIITLRIGRHGYGLEFNNTTRRIDGHDHPHVDAGRACMGNLSAMLPELIATNRYDMVIQMAIKFLQTANPDDVWGQRIVKWPLARGRKS